MQLYHLDWELMKAQAPDTLVRVTIPIGGSPDVQDHIKTAIELNAYKHVAEIGGRELNDVFNLTQNIDDSWAGNPSPGVRPTLNVPQRSTSVGDLIQDEHGQLHVISVVGLMALDPEIRILGA